MLAYRNIDVSYEAIRYWCHKFGPMIAKQLAKKRTWQPGDKWHMDEVRIVRNGEVFWLWHAIDQEGNELDILLQRRRNTKAAKRFFKHIVKKYGFITDKLRSYKAATRTILKTTEHRQHKRLNNKIERSHQTTRMREYQMRKFKSPGQAQHFLSIAGSLLNTLRVPRFKHAAEEYRHKLKQAFTLYERASSYHHVV